MYKDEDYEKRKHLQKWKDDGIEATGQTAAIYALKQQPHLKVNHGLSPCHQGRFLVNNFDFKLPPPVLLSFLYHPEQHGRHQGQQEDACRNKKAIIKGCNHCLLFHQQMQES